MGETMIHRLRQHWVPVLFFAALALLPLAAISLGLSYFITFATRVLVLAFGAVGLIFGLFYCVFV